MAVNVVVTVFEGLIEDVEVFAKEEDARKFIKSKGPQGEDYLAVSDLLMKQQKYDDLYDGGYEIRWYETEIK